jgi:predicted nucleic acid-binding protein
LQGRSCLTNSLVRTTYLADKSALARLPHATVEHRLRPLLEEGLVATCAIVDLEVLYSARSLVDFEAALEEQRAFHDVPITPDVMARTIEIHHELARRGQHRLPIPDLLVVAAAESVEDRPALRP